MTIHTLCEVINRISEKNQVILTTHNPLFIQRNHIKSNIIVDKGTVYEAKNIEEIRKILGVRVSNNLKSSNKVLVVEVDGSQHKEETQARRDRRKDRLLENAGIKILRLSTTTIECKEKIIEKLTTARKD